MKFYLNLIGVFTIWLLEKRLYQFLQDLHDNSFLNNYKLPKSTSEQIAYDNKNLQLHKLYGEVKNIRQSGQIELKKISSIYNNIISNYNHEWLILLEIYEILFETKSDLRDKVKKSLTELRKNDKFTDLIDNGLKLIK